MLTRDEAETRVDPAVLVREATEEDVSGIRDIFLGVYGEDYPYRSFLDPRWLLRSVFTDDILMLVAVDGDRVLGTASVVFDIGAHSDLIGEFGRLAVHPEARGRGVGRALMLARVRFAQARLHVGVVENRCVHPYSQRISRRQGFACVGFLPMKHRFHTRESVALYARHFGPGLALRNNHPRIVPEVAALARHALTTCGLPFDAIIDEDSGAWRGDPGYVLEDLTAEGLPALLRIERGRVRAREVFGPMRLQYGFFKLAARHATYLIAREGDSGPIAGALGCIWDDIDRAVKVFELIVRDEGSVRFLFERLLERCGAEWGVEYVEVDVSAHAPRTQRTLVELGFRPAAYIPAGVFSEVERLDVVRMVRLLVPVELGPLDLIPESQLVADPVIQAFTQERVLPRIAEALHRVQLFCGLDPDQLTRVASTCTLQEHAEGAEVFRAGDPPSEMLLPLEGRIAVLVGGQRVGVVDPGEALGELSLLLDDPHSATARALEPVVAAALSREALRSLARQRPDIGQVLYQNLARGLAAKLKRADLAMVGAE